MKRDTPTASGNQMMTFVNESGLYALIFGSKLESARLFKYWVTSEVLPSIRRTGGYIVTTDTMTDEEIMARAILIGQKTIERQKQQIAALQEHNNLLQKKTDDQQLVIDSQSDAIKKAQPKVRFAEAVGKSDDTISIDLMAKLLAQNGIAIGEKRLFEWLRKNLYISDQKSTWNRPYQKWIERGYFRVETSAWKNPTTGTPHVTYVPRITTKGQAYFVKTFLKNEPAPLFGAMTTVS